MMTKAKLTLDDQLAEFTDLALDGELSAQDEATLAPDPELRALEETVLRLRESIPNEDPGEEAVSRMWGEIKRQSSWKLSKPFGKTLKEIFPPRTSWQSRHARQSLTPSVVCASKMDSGGLNWGDYGVTPGHPSFHGWHQLRVTWYERWTDFISTRLWNTGRTDPIGSVALPPQIDKQPEKENSLN